jgi:Uma2 family endonuclease
MSIAEHTQVTPDELLRMPEGERFELVDGELVEQAMSVESSWIGSQCFARINAFVNEHRLGLSFGDGLGYRCFPEDLDRVRRPDASFIAKGRLEADQFTEGFCFVAPDLVVEVVSPGDLYVDVQRKVGEYRRAGVRLIWVISPAERNVTVYRGNGELEELPEHEELTGFDVLPGFRCAVKDLFPPADIRLML